MIENVFEFRGEPHHEICFVFEAWLDTDDLERLDGRIVVETDAVEARSVAC